MIIKNFKIDFPLLSIDEKRVREITIRDLKKKYRKVYKAYMESENNSSSESDLEKIAGGFEYVLFYYLGEEKTKKFFDTLIRKYNL